MCTVIGCSNDGSSRMQPLVRRDFLFLSHHILRFLVVFRHAGKPQKAMIAYEKALEWQELFDLAVQNRMSDEDLGDMAYRVAGSYLAELLFLLVPTSLQMIFLPKSVIWMLPAYYLIIDQIHEER